MHYCATVMVEPEYANNTWVRAIEILAPYDEAIDVEPYEVPCDGCTYYNGVCHECRGTGTRKTTYNPLSRYDYYHSLAEADGHYEEIKPGDATYAIVLPDEGWHSRARDGIVGNDRSAEEWQGVFEACYRTYTERGFIPVLIDCHI